MESKSESIKELMSALSKAQGEMGVALKDSDNPFFHSTYADLASVWEVVRGPLAKYGLCIIQIPELIADGRIVLITVLGHSSGEFITSHYPITPMKQAKDQGWVLSDDPQSIGSAITYAKRYALAAMLGIATSEDDDDGEKAMGRDKAGDKPATQKAASKLTGALPKKESATTVKPPAGTPAADPVALPPVKTPEPSPEMVKEMMNPTPAPVPAVTTLVPIEGTPENSVSADTVMTPEEVAAVFPGAVVEPPPAVETSLADLFKNLYSGLATVAASKSVLKARMWWSQNVNKISQLPPDQVQVLRDFVNSVKK